MVLYPNKLPESERVCSGICKLVSIKHYSNKVISYKHCELHQYLCEILTFLLFIDNKNE